MICLGTLEISPMPPQTFIKFEPLKLDVPKMFDSTHTWHLLTSEVMARFVAAAAAGPPAAGPLNPPPKKKKTNIIIFIGRDEMSLLLSVWDNHGWK